jgi:hypothetical protein
MAKKSLTRTLDTSTAEGQEQALRMLHETAQLTIAQPTVVVPPIVEPALAVEAPAKKPKVAKKPAKPEAGKRGRPAKGDPNEGSSVKQVADGSSVKRINMDFPLEMYERIEAEIDETGQTIKGFFLMLSKQYFKNRNNTPSV